MRPALFLLCAAAISPSVSYADASVPKDPQKSGNTFKATTCGQETKKSTTVTLPDGLSYEDLVVGTGALATRDSAVSVTWTVWLPTGERVDSGGLAMSLGEESSTIVAFREGVLGMRVGGKRRLRVPYALGYNRGHTNPALRNIDNDVHAAMTSGPLVFEVTLESILPSNRR